MTVVKDNSVKKLEKFTDEGIPAYKYLDNKIDYQIQELLKLKQQIQSVTAPDVPTKLSELSEDATHRVVTDTEKSTWNGKSNLALGETSVTAYRGDRGKEAYDAKHSHDNKTSVLDKFNNPTPTNGDIFQYNGTTEKYEATNKTELSEIDINNQTGTTYTLVLSDSNKLIRLSNASPITLTVPPNSSVAFNTGTVITLEQLGAGLLTIAAGSGVAINAYGGLNSAGQYAGLSLIKVDTNTWTLFGGKA